MRVYAESNFVLEVALVQEQHAACRKIISLCESGQAELVIPAFAIAEPYHTLDRRHKQRKKIKHELDDEFRQLARTSDYQQRLSGFQSLTALLIDSANEESKRLDDIRDRLLDLALILPLDAEVLAASRGHQIRYGLSAPDALVYASILLHLTRSPTTSSCFLNKNIKDFDDPDIVSELSQHNCKLLPRFDTGYQFIAASILPDHEESGT